MYIFILSILVFAIPVIILFCAYIYNDMQLKQIKFELEVEKQTSENLKLIFNKILGK